MKDTKGLYTSSNSELLEFGIGSGVEHEVSFLGMDSATTPPLCPRSLPGSPRAYHHPTRCPIISFFLTITLGCTSYPAICALIYTHIHIHTYILSATLADYRALL